MRGTVQRGTVVGEFTHITEQVFVLPASIVHNRTPNPKKEKLKQSAESAGKKVIDVYVCVRCFH